MGKRKIPPKWPASFYTMKFETLLWKAEILLAFCGVPHFPYETTTTHGENSQATIQIKSITKSHMSYEKNNSYFPWNTSCLIGILIFLIQ